MTIKQVMDGKKEYIDLLLLADEQEDMIDKYLERGEMFVLDDNGIKAECVITQEGDGVYELKNIAVLQFSCVKLFDCRQYLSMYSGEHI